MTQMTEQVNAAPVTGAAQAQRAAPTPLVSLEEVLDLTPYSAQDYCGAAGTRLGTRHERDFFDVVVLIRAGQAHVRSGIVLTAAMAEAALTGGWTVRTVTLREVQGEGSVTYRVEGVGELNHPAVVAGYEALLAEGDDTWVSALQGKWAEGLAALLGAHFGKN